MLTAAYTLSGAVVLALEVLWFRALALTFGVSAPAVMAVLAGYMLGMSGGAFVGGRLAGGGRTSPHRLLALLHLLMALSGGLLLLPHPLVVFPGWVPPPAQWLAGIVLVAPTAALAGAAFPAVAAAVPPDTGRASAVAGLYGLNILGGAAGMALTAFLGLELLGGRGCAVAAMISASLLALVFAALAGRAGRQAGGAPTRGPATESSAAAVPGRWLAAAFVLGFAGLGLETAAVRLLTPLMGLSVYALAGTVIPFLVGLGLGGVIARSAARRDARRSFALLATGAALALGAVPLLLPLMPGTMVWLAGRISPADLQWQGTIGARAMIALVALVPGAILAGTLFPLLLSLTPAGRRGPGAAGTGILAAFNTLGAVLGPVAVNAFLVGTVGTGIAYRLLAALYPVTGLAVIRGRALRVPLLLTVLGTGVLLLAPFPDPLELHAGVYWATPRYALMVDRPGRSLAALQGGRREVREMIEGPVASVLVVDQERQRYLIIDGKPASNTFIDSRTQKMLARIPFSLGGDFRRVLVIGWGSGQTAAEVLRRPVEGAVCVEISPEVVAASPWFAEVNGAALDDPRFSLVVDDGRHYLAGPGRSFDLVVSQPSNPWVGASGSLFTAEFFELARRRLNEGGLMVQWFQSYGATLDDLEMFLATFASAFPSWSLWSPSPGDLVLVNREVDARDLQEEVRPFYRFSSSEIELAARELNTDDRPLLSFRMARHIMRKPEGVLDRFRERYGVK